MSKTKRYLHADKDDTLERAVLCSRIFAIALSEFIGDKEITVSLEGEKYLVFMEDHQIKLLMIPSH